MPRKARIVMPGQPHHGVQRRNNLQDVFFAKDGRRAFLVLLREHCERFGFNSGGYCLMTNHTALVGTPALEDSRGYRDIWDTT